MRKEFPSEDFKSFLKEADTEYLKTRGKRNGTKKIAMLGSAAATAALTFGAFAGLVKANHSSELEEVVTGAVMIGAGLSTFYLYSSGTANAIVENEIARELDRREDSQEGGE